jgi:hypothetical protein
LTGCIRTALAERLLLPDQKKVGLIVNVAGVDRVETVANGDGAV